MAKDVDCDPTTTNIGAWQAEKFDLAKCLPIGIWDQLTDAPNLVANRRVRRINPDAAGTVAGRADLTIFPSWRARFDAARGDIPAFVEWLRPGWISTEKAIPVTEKRPVIQFWAPSGGYGDYRATNMDFFSGVEAKAEGLDHLVDGFHEGCRRMNTLGVQIIKHDGSPGIDRRYDNHTLTAYKTQHALNVASRAAIGLDAIVATERTATPGINEKTGDDYSKKGQGVLMEGVPDPSDPKQAPWLGKPWPIACVWSNAKPRLFEQAEWAKGRWPAAGTPQFDANMGAERWYVWCLEFDFSPTTGGPQNYYDKAWGDQGLAARIVSDWAQRIAAVRAKCPRSICLIPNGIPQLCMKHGIPASAFAGG